MIAFLHCIECSNTNSSSFIKERFKKKLNSQLISHVNCQQFRRLKEIGCSVDDFIFQILNPAWNDFVNEEVVAKIKAEMYTEFSFTPTLYKLLLYKTGSFFKPHRDSEKVDGMFATLVIQLPSLYKGGQLIVRHDGKTVTSDFSSNEDSSNSFATFFTAFYCDCEHEVLKVTEGYRVCLVYNLISHRSEIPAAPRRNALEQELVTLIKNWEKHSKLVYALKHKYSESNLSFDNLKTTDRAIANFLIYIAKSNDLSVYIAILNKESSGQSTEYYDFSNRRRGKYGRYGNDSDDEVSDCDADFDSNDEDYCTGKSYKLSKLVSSDGDSISISYLSVNFDEEVIPADCFENIDPYRKTAEPTGNAGTDVTRFYRSAAIVFWPKEFLLDILQRGGASTEVLDKVFLKEIDAYRGKVKDDNVKEKLKNWANRIISSGDNKSFQVIKAIVGMKDIELIQSLFYKGVTLNEASTSLMVDVCEKYGWKTLSMQIPEMFNKLTKEVGIQLLERICTTVMDEEKKAIVQSVMSVILDQSVSPSSSSASSSYLTWYVRPPTMEEKMKKRSEEQEFLLSACRLGEKVDFNMSYFTTAKPIVLFVPVLLRLVPNKSKTLTSFWKEIATHFVQEMQKEASKPAVLTDWRRSDRTKCSCKDCLPLNIFLGSDQETISFKMGKDRRKHLHQHMNHMKDIAHETNRGGNIGVLVIRKTSKSGFEEAEQRNFSKENLMKLRAILPKQ